MVFVPHGKDSDNRILYYLAEHAILAKPKLPGSKRIWTKSLAFLTLRFCISLEQTHDGVMYELLLVATVPGKIVLRTPNKFDLKVNGTLYLSKREVDGKGNAIFRGIERQKSAMVVRHPRDCFVGHYFIFVLQFSLVLVHL